jgi:DNA-binding NarL/FixJ family response regulator
MDGTAVVVDPHPLWIDAVKGVLTRLGFAVVGEAASVRGGLDLVREHRPSLLLVDPAAADSTAAGEGLLRDARNAAPGLRVIVVTDADDADSIESAFGAGAGAYVLKSAHPDDLAAAVRQVFSASMYLSRDFAAASRARSSSAAEVEDRSAARYLTKREREILQLVAEGHSNGQLARMLWVTEQTVKFHLSNIYRKLDVANRTEASRWAQLHGLLATPELELAAAS